MANQNNYDNYPNGPEHDSPYGFSGGYGDPRYAEPRREGYAPRDGYAPRQGYPEQSRYAGGQGYERDYGRGYADGYGSREADRRPAGRYDDYGRDYGRYDGYGRAYGEPGRGQAYDPYGSRAPQPSYDRQPQPSYDRQPQPAYDPYQESYDDPYAENYDGYGDEGYNEPEAAPEQEADAPRGYAFKVRNLTKDYDGNVVLNNISFDIPAGKIVGLLGPNGCGKTTLIKILAGLIHDYTGMIKIGGKPVGISSKASLAYLPDRTYFPERFRTIDCIEYFADFFKDFDKIKAIEFASRFGLDLHQRVKTMSKGMQEKLQLLVVMSRAADIYLLDEPLGGVDPAARGVILDIIMNNYKKNATVVLSTHQVNDLEHSFDHVLMLGHGQVLVNTGIETLRSTGKSVEDIFKEVIGDAWEVE